MPLKQLFLWLFIQVTILPALFSQTNEQLRANLYAFDNSGNAVLLDGNLTLYNLDFSNAVDDYDALKMQNFGENFGMLRGARTLIIERRHSILTTDSIFFKMWNMRQVKYKLDLVLTGLNKPGLTAVLEDLYLNTKTPLDLNGVTSLTFTISSEAGSSQSGRFRILFLNPSLIEQPMTFTSVNAFEKSNNVEVEWGVNNQKNIVEYDIEKSYDGAHFVKADSIAVTIKNSSNVYHWLDVNPAVGSHYYRIRSISNTGALKYSDTVMVNTQRAATSIGLYPNPVHGGNTVSIDFNNLEAGKYQLRLINSFGGAVFNKSIDHVAGASKETFSLNNIHPGIYLMQISRSGSKALTTKVIVQ